MFVKVPGSRELRTQKLRSYLLSTHNSNVLPLKSGVGQYTKVVHATPTASNFFLASFYLPGQFAFIFPTNLSRVSPASAVANAASCVGPQTKTGYHAHRHRGLMQVPALSARGIETGSKICHCAS